MCCGNTKNNIFRVPGRRRARARARHTPSLGRAGVSARVNCSRKQAHDSNIHKRYRICRGRLVIKSRHPTLTTRLGAA
eukprot:5011096-Prymnesium_polylepis.1